MILVQLPTNCYVNFAKAVPIINMKKINRYCTPSTLTTDPKHADGSLVELDENAVVDLAQAEQLQHLLDLRRNLVDTPDAHHKSQLRLGLDIVAEEQKYFKSVASISQYIVITHQTYI